MNMAEYGSRRLQQPANVNFEPIKRGLKSDFLFFEPFPCQLCCFSYQISLLEHQKISKINNKGADRQEDGDHVDKHIGNYW